MLKQEVLTTTPPVTISNRSPVCDVRGWIPHGLALSPLKPQRREGHLGCIKARRVAVDCQVTGRKQFSEYALLLSSSTIYLTHLISTDSSIPEWTNNYFKGKLQR